MFLLFCKVEVTLYRHVILSFSTLVVDYVP